MRGYRSASRADRRARGTRHVTAAPAAGPFPAERPRCRPLRSCAADRGLVGERQELRDRGAGEADRAQRVQLARAQWELAHALIDRHLTRARRAARRVVRPQRSQGAGGSRRASDGRALGATARPTSPTARCRRCCRSSSTASASRTRSPRRDARLDGVLVARPAVLRRLVGPARRALAAPGRGRARRDRDRARAPPRRRTGSCCCSVVVSGLGVAAYHPEGRSSPPTRAGAGARAG
jgi:hypothetical protein